MHTDSVDYFSIRIHHLITCLDPEWSCDFASHRVRRFLIRIKIEAVWTRATQDYENTPLYITIIFLSANIILFRCPDGHRTNSQRTKCCPTNSSNKSVPSSPGPRSSRLREDEDLNGTRRVFTIFATWIPPARCHLLHFHDQSQS